MKKTLVLILSCLMIITSAAMFTSCGSKSESSGSSESSKQTTVKFSYPAYGYDSDKEAAFWKKSIAQFEKENPDIKIEMTNEDWDSVFTKWDNGIKSGDTPDIGMCDYVDATAYGEQGDVLDVSDIIQAIGGEDALTDDAILAKDGDSWWSVPCVSTNIVLGYRTDLLKAAGYTEPPKTWKELKTMAEKLTKDGQYGLGMNLSNTWLSQQVYFGFVKAAGGSFEDNNGTITVGSDPANVTALNYMCSLYKDGVIPKAALSWENGDELNALATGQIAMSIGWGGFGSTVADSFPDQADNIKYTVLPIGPSGKSGSFVGNAGFFIFKDAKHPKEAKKFIEFIMQDEIQKEWVVASGNASPIKAVAKDSELKKASWYNAIVEQAPTGTNYYIGGPYNAALSLYEQGDGYVSHIQAVLKGADAKAELQKAQKELEKKQNSLKNDQ